MKKEIVIVAIALLLLVTPAFAEQGRGSSDKARGNHGTVVSEEKKIQVHEEKENEVEVEAENEGEIDDNAITSTPTTQEIKKDVKGISVTADDCDSSAEWKNHGAYVSCVAKLHLGGKTVSQAARSDIGKKQHGEPSITPSVSPTATPTATITPTPTEPVTSPESTLSFAMFSLENLKKAIGHLINSIPFFSHHA
jgi:hypothetical protein